MDQEKIRQRAYEIWDRDGRQDGRAHDHWLQAEREFGTGNKVAPVDGASASEPAEKTAPVKTASAKTASVRTAPAKSDVAKSDSAKTAGAAPRKRRGAQALPPA